jgi:hypothetical protein
MSTLEYLRELGIKAVAYDEVRSDVIAFILENTIRNENIATDLFILAFLWLAERRGEMLTDQDLMMLIDNESDVTSIPTEVINVYRLQEDQVDLELDELLMQSYQNKV